ncbi:DNA-binding response regulator [Caballeronia glathei]|jgi:two-component system OmpR family response regulator|uniref:Transcriptional regulator n=1 Tax=Caballeronia glathei TaxID=60547 RepID=A0A069PGD9_9BURK|nr:MULTISPECIES: response regulator transcription factor [Burkholderiaceae]KDR39748.1 transcriptional regulator [Caballeronia glathei]TCK44645.1 winged helix family two component transcriptional regulator [Paraburkholderia sp. BL8N3]CDY79944.1 DNA-binding response regulator [Caballeronia glathei]
MRILIAEDDSILADGLVRSLRQSGYAVDHVKNGAEADTALSLQTFDLLILDLGLPLMSGLEVLRRLRARNSQMPVLILTAADSVDERVKGLDLGADDYMAKPFALNELEARVRALTRRGAGGGPTVVKHGSLAFDQVGRIASINDQVIELSARELGVLEVLLQRIGRLVSKEQLVNHLCEWGEEVSNNAIEVYVHRLRKKIEPSGARIMTVRGLGYSLEKNTGAASGNAAATPSGAQTATRPGANAAQGPAAAIAAGASAPATTAAAAGTVARADTSGASPDANASANTPSGANPMPASHHYK